MAGVGPDPSWEPWLASAEAGEVDGQGNSPLL